MSELETQQEPETAIEEPAAVHYVAQRNPHIPECAFCRRQVAPLLYVMVPRKPADKSPQKALTCPDCLPGLLTHTLALLAEASEAALKAWHHLHLPELVSKAERKAMAGHLAASQGAGKARKR